MSSNQGEHKFRTEEDQGLCEWLEATFNAVVIDDVVKRVKRMRSETDSVVEESDVYCI